MASRYKVRLDDGSEIELELQAIKDWKTQGLLTRDSPVLRPGSKRWEPLSVALGLEARRDKTSPGPSRPAPKAVPSREIARQTWRTMLAGVLLIAAAAGAFFYWLRPERWLASLEPAPWRELALGLLATGLALVRGWEGARRAVRVLAPVAGLSLFALAGILLAQGMRGRELLVLACAWVASAGLFALLSGGWLSRLQSALSVLFLVAGVAGVGYLGTTQESAVQRLVRDSLVAERSLSDADFAFNLELRDPWRLLRAGQQVVPVPAEARVVLARPRRGGFAYLLAERAPRGVLSVDDYLGRVLRSRAGGEPGLAQAGRHEVTVGGIDGRAATAHLESEGVRVRDVTAAWRNGWIYYALVTRLPDDGSLAVERDLEALRSGFHFTTHMAKLLADSVEAVTREVPLLSRASAEALLRDSAAQALAPEQAFRRGFALAAAGMAALPAAEAREMSSLTASAYAALAGKERIRLGAYLERVRSEQPTLPEDDREMCALMKAALLRFDAQRLARVQELYGKAIAVGLSRG